MEIYELRSNAVEIKAEICDLNAKINQHQTTINHLEKVSVFNMKYNNYVAPLSFRIKIDHLINNSYISNIICQEELKQMSKYFSSFMHPEASNGVASDPNQMQQWVDCLLNDNESITENFRFKGATKRLTINLKKNILQEIIDMCRADEESDDNDDDN